MPGAASELVPGGSVVEEADCELLCRAPSSRDIADDSVVMVEEFGWIAAFEQHGLAAAMVNYQARLAYIHGPPRIVPLDPVPMGNPAKASVQP